MEAGGANLVFKIFPSAGCWEEAEMKHFQNLGKVTVNIFTVSSVP